MDLVQIREQLKKTLKKSRYNHSIGVEEVSCDLAYIYGYDPEKASLAGLLHDCAKHLSDPELLTACEKYRLPVSDIERECPFLLHAKVGAVYAETIFYIADSDILKAIQYHTTGRPAMSLLEKIIFTADYIEPYRKPLPRIELIRSAAYQDLDKAVYMILENTLNYLTNSAAIIDMVTVETYKYYEAVLQTH